MKRTSFFIPRLWLFLSFSGVIFSGCMNGTDSMNNNFSFTIDKVMTTSISAQGTAQAVDTLDSWQSCSEFMRNRSFVRSLEMRSMTCMVTDAEGNPLSDSISGSLGIGGVGGSPSQILATFGRTKIGAMMTGFRQMTTNNGGMGMFKGMMMDSAGMGKMYFICEGMRDSMRLSMQFHIDMNAQCSGMGMMH
jgi:hypothetical protein